jgi:hypothetical protein
LELFIVLLNYSLDPPLLALENKVDVEVIVPFKFVEFIGPPAPAPPVAPLQEKIYEDCGLSFP